MRLLLVAGNTETAGIEGISAAGATPSLRTHTPAADAEIVVYGRPVYSPVVPVSPTGCPTPAAVTRAVRDVVGLDVTVIDGGMASRTAAPTVDVGAIPGGDVRSAEPVPDAGAIYEAAREFGRCFPADQPVLLGETIPAGTTTALGVLEALGERATVSSSLANNPIGKKRTVVETGLRASGLTHGGALGEPVEALRTMGDPVLATAAGVARGAIESDTPLTLAGGTQLLAVAALLRHDGVEAPLELATTELLVADDSAEVAGLAATLSVAITATDPGFEGSDHPAAEAYRQGEATEGVGMGGALHVAAQAERPMHVVRDRFETITDRLTQIDETETAALGEQA